MMRFALFLIAASAWQPAAAAVVTVDPDAFPVGTVIDAAFPGVALSVDGRPASSVQVLDGFSAFNGRNLATTGTRVFGQLPIHSVGVPQGWDDFNGRLRADFAHPTDFVRIDLIFDDNDFGSLRAFNAAGAMIGIVPVAGDGRGPTPFVTATIAHPVADIAYVIAGGDNGEALFLDNLAFDAIPEPPALGLLIALALFDRLRLRRRRAGDIVRAAASPCMAQEGRRA